MKQRHINSKRFLTPMVEEEKEMDEYETFLQVNTIYFILTDQYSSIALTYSSDIGTPYCMKFISLFTVNAHVQKL